MRRPYLKFFFRTFGWFTALMLPIVTAYILIDPLHALRFHEEQNPITYEYSRAISSINYFDHYNDSIHYDSFIIGSSVAECYDIDHWKKYLPEGSRPYYIHYAAQTIEQLRLSLDYIANKAPLRNVLVVLTPKSCFFTDYNGVQYIASPKIEKNYLRKARNYFNEFKFCFDRRAILSYLCVKVLNLEKPYDNVLPWLNPPSIEDKTINLTTCPITDSIIDISFLDFKTTFPDGDVIMRKFPISISPNVLNEVQIEHLKAVRKLLEDSNCNYRVVMTPAANHLPNPTYLTQLSEIFGGNFIDLSIEFHYYFLVPGYAYDFIHPTRRLTRILLDRIYGDPSPNAAVPL